MSTAVELLRALHSALTEWVEPTHRNLYGFPKVKRRMTPEEWKSVQATIVEHDLLCVPHNAGMGFNFGMALYEHPTYPGLDPEFVIDLEGHHLPEPLGTKFDDAWDAYSPFTHDEANGMQLERLGFAPLHGKAHYEY